MYSWALFFVTATFLYARDVMSGKGGWKTWLIITLFTLCAAYTHYYALLSVSIIWVIMLVWFCLRDRRMLLRLFVCGIIVVIVCFPWLVILLQQVRQVSAEYWIKFTTGELLLTCFFLFLPIHFILPFLFVKVLRTKNGRISFDDIMGLCVLIGIFVVGLIMSIVIKPVLVARYIFPAGLCIWISVFLIFRHARNKEKFLFVCLLLFAFLVSSCKKVGHFVNDCKDMQATHLLLDTIDNDATFAYETDNDGLDYLVLSCFTNNEIVAVMTPPRTPFEEKMLNSMFRNVTVFGYRKEMWKYLKSFKKIYYISHNATSGDAEAILPPGYTGVYIGDYRIEQSCHIYKLIPNGEHGE
ncbi:MAG: hypothetical protein LUI08_05230 [Prevotella sp.]|nr:hypothetical protein [Prevotella sp.]